MQTELMVHAAVHTTPGIPAVLGILMRRSATRTIKTPLTKRNNQTLALNANRALGCRNRGLFIAKLTVLPSVSRARSS